MRVLIIILLVINVVLGKLLFIRWYRFKLIYSEVDTIFNTGLFKGAIIEIIAMLVMPYPMVHNIFY